MRKSLWLSPIVVAVVALAFLFGPSLADAGGGKKAAQKAGQAKKAKKADKKKDKKKGQLEVLFKKLDGDKDSKVSKDEFAKLKETLKPLRAEKGKQAKKADANAKKAKKADKKKGKKGGQLFEKLDANKDGSLVLEEFKKL